MKREGIKTVVFIGVILLMGVALTGMFMKNRIMVIVGVSALLAVALIASVALVLKLTRRYKRPPEPVSDDDEFEREKEKSERRRAPVRELFKNTLLIGGFLTSCVLFVIFCSIKEFVLACIVWGCGVGLTLLAFCVMLIRERIQRSDLGKRRFEAERRAEEKPDMRRDREYEEPRVTFARDDERARDDSESLGLTPRRDTVDDMSDRYKLEEAAVRSAELTETRDDTVECGGRTYARRYGLYRISLQAGGETRTAVCAAPHRRGEFVQALFGANGGAVILSGTEIKLGSGKYKQSCGKVKMCIVDIASMVEKRRRTGDVTGEGWAVDPDYRYIITADVGGRRVRAESEVFYTEGTSVDLIECRGSGVAVFVD